MSASPNWQGAKKIAVNKAPLSIVIPAFNEEATIAAILEKIVQLPLERNYEIIVVDDGSTDGTTLQIARFRKTHPLISLKVISKENQGKGSAVKRGIAEAQHDIVIIQDADLEYDPNDYFQILDKMDKGATVVYGSRNLNQKKHEDSSFLFYWGGVLVTFVTNLLFGSQLTDEATCYKCFRKDIFETLSFDRHGFGWEPEITARILKAGISIEEVSISYHPRTADEGKKISWKDGVKAIWILCYERINN